MFKLAIIGPQDLVDRSCAVAKDYKSIDLLRLPYESEEQTRDLVSRHEREVDGFLFTGFLPYFRMQSEGTTKKPLFYYPILGESLYRTLLLIKLHNSIDITRVSIDTLTKEQVTEAYSEIDIDSSTIIVNDKHLDEFSFEQYVDFHKSAFLNKTTYGAITAVNSVQTRLLEEGIPAFKIVPTLNTIRRTFGSIEAAGKTLAAEAAQIVVLIVSMQNYDPEVAPLSQNEKQQRRQNLYHYLVGLVNKYRASLFTRETEENEYIIYVSKGMFREYLNDYVNKPLTSEILSSLSIGVNVGIGMGRSALEAEDNARGALILAKSKPGLNMYMMNQDKEVTGLINGGSESTQVDYTLKSEDGNLLKLSELSGLSISTLTRIQGLMRGLRRDTITASELGSAIGVSKRTASRVLLKLSLAGLADSIGVEQPIPRGRPRNLYKISL